MTDIEAIKKYHGLTTKQAQQYKKETDENTIKQIKEYYKTQSKKAFYED